MPIYQYTALNELGESIKGSLTCTSLKDATLRVTELGLYPSSIRKQISISISQKRLKSGELHRFIKSLVALLKSGLSLMEALFAISQAPENKIITQYVEAIVKDIKSGKSFSESCAVYPEVFDGVFVGIVAVGEKTGNIIQALIGYQHYLEQKLRLTRKIKSALTYPIFLLASLAVVLLILFLYVIPGFSDLFESFGAELPAATNLVIDIAKSTPVISIASILLSIIFYVIYHNFKDDIKFQVHIDSLLNKMPFFGKLRKKSQLIRLVATMSYLNKSGASFSEIMEMVVDSFQGTNLGLAIKESEQLINEGESLVKSFEISGVMKGYSLSMLSVGEKSSSIGVMLADIADFQQDELDESIERFTQILEPFLILIMGLIMGFVVVAMYLPIFLVSDVVQ